MHPFEKIASTVVRLGSFWRNQGYDLGLIRSFRPPLPTICVGNLSFGGAGKTPLAVFLLGFLQKKGWSPCFLSRGYRGAWEKRGGIVSNGHRLLANWEQAGDEPFMVANKVPSAPVIVGRNRYLSCLRAVELGCNVAVLDDAFQHRRLGRDLDIVLISPNDRPQRESWRSLRRAHVVLVRGGRRAAPEGAKKIIDSLGAAIMVFGYDLLPDSLFFLNTRKSTTPEFLKGQKIVAFCGLAAPQNFRLSLENLGASILAFFAFPDHYPYPGNSLRRMGREIKRIKPDLIITTEKDAVKLSDQEWFLSEIPVCVLKIRFTAEKAFDQALEDFLQSVLAKKNRITLSAEKLKHQETNLS